MADGASEAPLWMPDLGDMPKGPRAVMVWFIIWRDGRGSCDPTHEELGDVTGFDVSTVRRHTGWLEKNAWVSRERRRRPDNSLGGYRYWLDLEKLGLGRGDRSNCAVAPGTGEGVSKPVGEADATAQIERSVEGATAEGTAGIERSRPRNLSGPVEEHGPARAEVSLPSLSYFHSFPWRDEVTKVRAGEILAACGEGLGGLGEQNNRVLLSLAYVLEPDCVWAEFDHALDVLPVVKLKTGPGRSSKLWDFALLTDNLERHRAKRLRPVGVVKARASKAMPPAPELKPDEQRAKRMAALRREIAIIDRGERPAFLLPAREQRFTGEFLEDAFQALRRRNVEELAGLESTVPAGAEGA